MHSVHSQQLILLFLATLFISTSGVLGKLIDLPVPVIIWSRCAIAAILLFFYCRLKNISIQIATKKQGISLLISSVILGLHWITYFYALKLANVTLAMLSIFTFPIFTALLEPFFIKIKFDIMYIVLGILILVGILFITPKIDINNTHFIGVLVGVFSAILYAIRNILSKKLTSHYHASGIMFYQTLIISLLLLPAIFILNVDTYSLSILSTSKYVSQLPYIMLLGVITTAIGHTLLVNSLNYFSASTASIINSIQPVLGILLAIIFLHEVLDTNVVIGGSLILASVIIESFRRHKKTDS